MSKILNKKTIITQEPIAEIIITREVFDQIKSKIQPIKLPREKIIEFLKDKDIDQLEVLLFNNFLKSLPNSSVCGECIKQYKSNIPNCDRGIAYDKFRILYTLSAINLVTLIELNRPVLSKKAIQDLAVLFYTKAFKFENSIWGYRIGEMAKYLIREGFKEVSIQLEQMGIDEAKKLIQKNYFEINDEIVNTKLGDQGYTDYQKIEKKFWKNKKEVFEHRREFEPLNKTKISFKATLSEPQLTKLFEELKSNQIISNNTSKDIFLSVFNGTVLSSIKTKINWQKANNLLAYFIDAMIREKIIKEGNHWNIAEHCFTKSRNLANASSKYKETKTGQPKEAVIINDILKGL